MNKIPSCSIRLSSRIGLYQLYFKEKATKPEYVASSFILLSLCHPVMYEEF